MSADCIATYWEALAPHRPGAPVEDFGEGSQILSRAELDAIGDVSGRRVLQVAASVGDEAIRLAQLGGQAVAVDLAPSHVRAGKAKASALGVEVDYRVADMTDLPADLTDFDVILISWGGLCWLDDLQTWAIDMSQRLRSGGRLVIAEHHPIWEILSVAGADRLSMNRSYFDPSWCGARDRSKEPEVVAQLAADTGAANARVWGIGEVVSAVLGAGLTLTSLREYGDSAMYPGLTASAHLPSTYIVTAER
jgi:SAM-dependent methyltransferase